MALKSNEKFTQRAEFAIEKARLEAQTLGHSYVGTEHLLLGILSEQSGLGGRLLPGAGRMHMLVCMGVAILAAVLGFLAFTFTYLLQVLGVTEAMTQTQLISESLTPYTISDVLLHPVHSIWVVINTLLMFADFYLKGMFAGPLGWLNIEINPFWCYSLLLLMVLSVLPMTSEASHLKKRDRTVFVLVWIMIFAMALASMFVSWTTAGNLTVSGLQGRYFTPVFLLLLFTCARTNVLVLKRDISRETAFLGLALGLIIVNNILSSTQAL